MKALPLPEYFLTLLAPWLHAMRYAEKRLENRHASVGKAASKWRYSLGVTNVPVIGLSQSKATDIDEVRMVSRDLIDRGLWPEHRPTYREVKAVAGTFWLAAELLDVLPPERCKGDPWHVPGQWGLILGRVWEVKPIPCTGGVGLWLAEWCQFCGHVYSISSRRPPECKTCKRSGYLQHGDTDVRPEIEIVTEVL